MTNPDVALVYERHNVQNSRNDNRAWDRQFVESGMMVLYPPDAPSINCTIIDIAPGGAGIHGELKTGKLLVDLKNIQLAATIRTRSGQFNRMVTVSWMKVEGNQVHCGIQYLDHVGYRPETHTLKLDEVRINPAVTLKVPASLAIRRRMMPLVEINGIVHVAAANTENRNAFKVIERMVKAPIQAWKVEAKLLEQKARKVFGEGAEEEEAEAAKKKSGKPKAEEDGEEIIRMSHEFLYAAYLRNASDIHIDPRYDGICIRFRVDGQLEEHTKLDSELFTELSSRYKVMANLDIAEKRAPQDGRFTHQFVEGGERADIRVATLPTKYGERITMRILGLESGSLTLDKLGLDAECTQSFANFLMRTQGLLIMTGPTGSGKSTTLYAALRQLLKARDVNVITVEDPIEYEIDGVAQCEVGHSEKMTFATALRSILRHDPDVVMLGEIRDAETADIAMKAALTGHMVMGTLHTNSAAATITRLVDMGVPPYLVAAALRLAVAQRLVRRLCSHCRIPRQLLLHEANAFGRPDLAGEKVYEAGGCIYCAGKGFAGRIGLYEVLELQEEWGRGIAEGKNEEWLVDQMKKADSHFLVDDALEKLLAGDAAVSEVMHIASSW